MKLVVAESLILAGVLFLAAYVLSDFVSAEEVQQSGWIYGLVGRLPGYALRQPALVVLPCIALYWGLQLLGHSRFAFWAILLLVVLLQGPAIWAHNQLQLFHLFGVQTNLEPAQSQVWQTALFLASLIGLVALYRTIRLRKLDCQLTSQGADDADRRRIVAFEVFVMSGLVGSGLLLSCLIIMGSRSLGRFNSLFDWSPWGVLSIGSVASILVILTVVLWFRSRESPEVAAMQQAEGLGAQLPGRRNRPSAESH